MNSLIIIPARYSSSRFPGKPLVEVSGMPMIQRVWSIANSVSNSRTNVRVVVATDDDRIQRTVKSFGGEVVMTSSDCTTGTDRVMDAVRVLNAQEEIVLSFQGDALLTPPWVLEELIDEFLKNPELEICTPAVLLKNEQREAFVKNKEAGSTSGTTVVFNNNRDALYFSKHILPNSRNKNEQADIYRHIGVYAYRRDVLEQFATLPEGRLESAEKLEQLRALEAGISIRVVVSDLKKRSLLSVDNPEDVQQVEQIILKEGELVL